MDPAPEIKVTATENVVCASLTGEVTSESAIAAVAAIYSLAGARNIVWDVSAADLSALARVDFAKIATAVLSHDATANRKIAFVVGPLTDMANAFVYANTAIARGVRAEYNAFRDSAAAARWLKS